MKSSVNFGKLRKLLARMHENGDISWPQVEMILRTVHLSKQRVETLQVARSEVVSLQIESTVAEVVTAFTESRFSRLPVVQGSLDNVVGVLYARDWIEQSVDEDDEVDLRSCIREPLFVSEVMPVLEAFEIMREKKITLALTRDEHGDLAGLFTLEDIIEQVFDDIEDEYDEDDPDWVIAEHSDSLVVDGATPLSYLAETYNIVCDEEIDIETIGGLIAHRAGVIPPTGQEIETPLGVATVLHSDGRRISRVRLARL